MPDLLLRNATVDGRPVDVTCDGGRVVGVEPVGSNPTDAPAEAADVVDLEGGVLLPAAAEPHAHLDKVLTADAVPNPTGDLLGAIDAWRATYDDRTVDDIATRAGAVLRRLVLAGVTAVRTHVDCGPGVELRAVETLLALRETWSPLIDVQVVALVAPPTVGPDGDAALARLDRALALGIDLVGGVPYAETDPRTATRILLDRAASAGVGVDFHTDETLDPDVLSLADLADLAGDFPHPVTASHCCSLAMQDPGRQAEVAAAVAEAGIGIVALPQTNLFLQARDQWTAPPRGLTAVPALREAGARLCAGADNVQDPFNTMGRVDPCETAALMVMAGHVQPEEGWRLVADAARDVLGLAAAGPRVGAVADLVALPGSSVGSAIADASAARTVIRSGRVVARSAVHVDTADTLLE